MKIWICLFCLMISSGSRIALAEEVLALETPHALLMEVSTGKVLYEKEADTSVHPASVTKIMTILLIMEAVAQGKIKLEDTVVTSAHAKSMGGSQVFLEEGELQTVETMLKCIVIASGNDAAVAMAEHIGGSEQAFVQRMNERAAELGMKNTHFVDCCGLTDSTDHYTSARDVALMSRELLLNHPEISSYSSIWMEDITHETRQGTSPFTLTNTNKLLRSYEGCDGIKTGSTSLAKYCLSSTAERNGIRLISVVLTAPDSKTRFRNASELLNYGFGICSIYRDSHEDPLPSLPVQGGKEEMVGCAYETEFSYLSTEAEDFSQITFSTHWEEEIKAPLKKGQPLGEKKYYLGKKELGRCVIIAAEDVEKAGFSDCLKRVWELYRV
ncbi:MAG: D-alanyl-D-alanine carboxypeptidase [Lachnospiraceae bacterium]|nr:D-alanyl-D-alanine carboxypeptidase [Lachnospiraceae bacterium]